jgi:hypothetical protein
MRKTIIKRHTVFGNLQVIRECPCPKHAAVKRTYYLVKCLVKNKYGNICGNKIRVRSSQLLSGLPKSCGCLLKLVGERNRAINTRYKYGKHPLMHIFSHMRARCYNKKHPSYKNYGRRGIKICKKWLHDPDSFVIWSMSHGWRFGLTLDRRNNNKNYTPKNCRFIPWKPQQNNRRNNIFYRSNKKIIYTLSELADKYNIKYNYLHRLARREKLGINQALKIIKGKKYHYIQLDGYIAR